MLHALTQEQWKRVVDNEHLIGEFFSRRYCRHGNPKRQTPERLLLELVLQASLMKAARTYTGKTKFGYWFDFVAKQQCQREYTDFARKQAAIREYCRRHDEPECHDRYDDSWDTAIATRKLVSRAVRKLGWSKQQADAIVGVMRGELLIHQARQKLQHSHTWVVDRVNELKEIVRDVATRSDWLMAQP